MKYSTRGHIAHSTLIERMESFFGYSLAGAEKELIKLQCAVNPAQIELRIQHAEKNSGLKNGFIVSLCTSHEGCYHITHQEPAGGLVICYGSDVSCMDFLLEFKRPSRGEFVDPTYTHSINLHTLAAVLYHYCNLSSSTGISNILLQNINSGERVICQIGDHISLYIIPDELLHIIDDQGVVLETLLIKSKVKHITPFLTMRIERNASMDILEFLFYTERLKEHLDTIY